MAYRLENVEPVKDGLRRVAREQLDAAVAELTEGVRTDPVAAIHNARKHLKKERSLLRLGRRGLEPSQRRHEAKAFRHVARELGSARDAEVMVQALDALSERYAGQVPEVIFAAIRERLEVQRDGARLQLLNSPSIGDAVEQLSAARLRLDHWRISAGGWRVVGDGLGRSYRRGRKAFREAHEQRTPEKLHTWRKRSKDVWYQLRLLEPIAPGTMRGSAKEVHHLADLLGDDHDLSELRSMLTRISGDLPADVGQVIGLLDHRREQLQTEAFFVGQRVYAERPKAFRVRIHRYWKAWRTETRAISSRRPAELADSKRASVLS